MRRLSRRHKGSLLAFILILLTTVATQSGWLNKPLQQAQQSQPGLYNVAQFIDGDTIAVDMNGHNENIRMIGVDTPETHKPNTPVQCYGPEAAANTQKLIGDKRVRLEADPLDTNRDRYGRLLRYVYLPDGTLLEDKIIAEGYGFAYTQFPFKKTDQFTRLEAAAKAAGKGLWSACQVTVEAGGRKQTQAIQ